MFIIFSYPSVKEKHGRRLGGGHLIENLSDTPFLQQEMW
jgi:hypothetical protein